MTCTKDLYSVLIELEHGTAGLVEVVYNTFSERKLMGPMLIKLFEYNDIKVLKATTLEWKLNVHGTIKYLNFNQNHPKINKSRVTYIATVYI